LEIAFVLDQELDLQGNGWFDDDPEANAYLSNRYEEVARQIRR